MKTEQFNRLNKTLRRKAGTAISDYHMIADFRSMQRVMRSHMLDTDLHDFAAVSVQAD